MDQIKHKKGNWVTQNTGTKRKEEMELSNKKFERGKRKQLNCDRGKKTKWNNKSYSKTFLLHPEEKEEYEDSFGDFFS